uniref:Uncharacterized protein ORF259 n=1 Tax=Moneuplotes minuta TaxID=74792 RepID=D1LDM7_9SPIT|nr:hypothetical protein [Moneuplotes minuta]
MEIKAPTYLPTNQLLPKTKETSLTSLPLTHLFDIPTDHKPANCRAFTNTARRLYLFSFFLQSEASLTLPCPNKLNLCDLSSPKITKPFTLNRLVPSNIKGTNGVLLNSNNYKNYPSFFLGTPTPLAFDLLYTSKLTSTRTLRWLSNYSPVSAKDVNYIRNLPALFYTSPLPTNKQPLTHEQANFNTLLVPQQSLEWLSYRSNFLSQLTSIQTLPQHKTRFNPLLLKKEGTPRIGINVKGLTVSRIFRYWDTVSLVLTPLSTNNALVNLYTYNLSTHTTKQNKSGDKKLYRVGRWI